jgi:hypothetical protein
MFRHVETVHRSGQYEDGMMAWAYDAGMKPSRIRGANSELDAEQFEGLQDLRISYRPYKGTAQQTPCVESLEIDRTERAGQGPVTDSRR